MRLLCLIFLFLLAPLWAGSHDEREFPPASSGYDMDTVILDAVRWSMAKEGREWRFVTNTGSMLPGFGSNSILLLEPFNGPALQNDIIVYVHGDSIISHRAEWANENGARMKGDNNKNDDGFILNVDMRYRVTGVLYAKRAP